MKHRYILVVDDDLDLAEAIQGVLIAEGYEVHHSCDGLEALEHLAVSPAPALILLDWMMPRCDGATFRARQKTDPALAAIPVVIFTGSGRFNSKALKDETAPVLGKPA